MRSEIHLRDPAGNGIDGFAPLSRLWPAADGWVRTHANYPWHRAALLTALGVTDDPGPAIAALPATEVEHRVYAAGGLAVAARTPEQWRAACPPDSPLITLTPTTYAPALPASTGPLPASGLRILDLTRVIAGPAGTRMLAALGAHVLRVDDPNRPELPLHALDGVIGKASTEIDATTAEGLRTLDRLIGEADVVVTGYRPGALRSFGLAPDQIAERHPGTIVATPLRLGNHRPMGRPPRLRQPGPDRHRNRLGGQPRRHPPRHAPVPAARPRHRLPARRRHPHRPGPPGPRRTRHPRLRLSHPHRDLAAGSTPQNPLSRYGRRAPEHRRLSRPAGRRLDRHQPTGPPGRPPPALAPPATPLRPVLAHVSVGLNRRERTDRVARHSRPDGRGTVSRGRCSRGSAGRGRCFRGGCGRTPDGLGL